MNYYLGKKYFYYLLGLWEIMLVDNHNYRYHNKQQHLFKFK